MERLTIGAIEIGSLPDLQIEQMHIRVDTGAKTSSLHVDGLQRFRRKGKPHVRFNIHPSIHNVANVTECAAPIKDIRRIKSSNGNVEERYVIDTTLQLGDQKWVIELSLSDRSDMTYLMLLGREGMKDRILVDPSAVFLVSELNGDSD